MISETYKNTETGEFWCKTAGECPFVAQIQAEVEMLSSFILEGHCPEAYGFEGPETFPECGKCVYCQLKKSKMEDETIATTNVSFHTSIGEDVENWTLHDDTAEKLKNGGWEDVPENPSNIVDRDCVTFHVHSNIEEVLRVYTDHIIELQEKVTWLLDKARTELQEEK